MTMTPKQFEVIDYQPETTCSTSPPKRPRTGDGNPGHAEEGPGANEQQGSPLNERIHVLPKNPRFGDSSLDPQDIKLSSAMAMSAAAMSPHLGAFEQAEQSVTHIFSILGLEMAARIVYNIFDERKVNGCCRVRKKSTPKYDRSTTTTIITLNR